MGKIEKGLSDCRDLLALFSVHASIHFYFDARDEAWVIEEIESSLPGGGKKILERFAKEIGQDQQIRLWVTEPETIKHLDSLGILEGVETEQTARTLTDLDLFRSLKMTRLLMGGGVSVDRLVVTPWEIWDEASLEFAPAGHKVEILIFGSTGKQMF